MISDNLTEGIVTPIFIRLLKLRICMIQVLLFKRKSSLAPLRIFRLKSKPNTAYIDVGHIQGICKNS